MAIVTAAEPTNIEELATLLAEMDQFYGAAKMEPTDVRLGQVRKAIFSNPPAAYVLLAREDNQLAGFAAYSFLWPAVGLTRSLYIKELYVAEAYRRTGIGTLLMRSLVEVATSQECSRVEWTTDHANANAQRFYEKIGMRYPSKVFFRLEGEDLRRASGR